MGWKVGPFPDDCAPNVKYQERFLKAYREAGENKKGALEVGSSTFIPEAYRRKV